MCFDCHDFMKKRPSKKENCCLAGNREKFFSVFFRVNVQMREENEKKIIPDREKTRHVIWKVV